MATQSSQAYDLSLFEKQPAKVIPLKTDPGQAKRSRMRRRIQTLIDVVVTAAAALGVAAIVAMIIVSKIELTEMNNEITQRQNQIVELQAETERLKGKLAAQTSAQSIEEYAQQHGLQKVDAGQKLYLSVDTEDHIEAAETGEDNILKQIFMKITTLFG